MRLPKFHRFNYTEYTLIGRIDNTSSPSRSHQSNYTHHDTFAAFFPFHLFGACGRVVPSPFIIESNSFSFTDMPSSRLPLISWFSPDGFTAPFRIVYSPTYSGPPI